MSRRGKPRAVHILTLVVLLLAAALAGAAPPQPARAGPNNRVAYVYNTDTGARDSFNTLLISRGLQVDLVPLASAATFNFSADDAIIIGDDTGNLDTWGTPEAVNNINRANKLIVGVGEGGYAYFGKLSLQIGWGNGAHGGGTSIYTIYPSHPVFAGPNPVALPANRILALYTASQNVIEIYRPSQPLAAPLGRDVADPNYLPLTTQSAGTRCYALWGFSGAPSAMTTDGQNLFMNMVVGNPCGALSLTSIGTDAPPSIDGFLGFGEWTNPNRIPLEHGFITAVNDGIRLYLLVDVLDDTGNDPPSSQSPDYFWLTFDTNRNGQIDANTDLQYATVPGTNNMRLQRYLGPGQWTGLSGPIRSSLGPGFGCFFADGTLRFTFPRLSCASHRVWEFGIDLREIGAAPGGSARMGLRVASGNPGFTDNIPISFDSDFSNLITISLAPAALPPSSGAGIAFSANPLEVTQAIQTPSNSLPLVANKTTVARTYVRSTGASVEPAITYLYGARGGLDLPGSPLAQLVFAKPTPNRTQLNDSGNFRLPASWIAAGGVTFQVGAARLTDGPIFSGASTLTFQARKTPLVWVVPINQGTAAAPNLASDAAISQQESYMRAVYPVPDVRFVHKPWQDIGAVGNNSLEDTISRLNKYYNGAVLAWVLSVIFTGKAPFDLPDQVYGFRTTGGGLSDPVWGGGAGRVAAGFLGTSLEGTMAHEINHNLDRSSAGTWGRHVANPACNNAIQYTGGPIPAGCTTVVLGDGNTYLRDTNWGCGATGPDGSWPTPPNNDNIREVGFDTRLPWSGSTVVAANWPDFMSYCQSGGSPTKWTSPYRWQREFTSFAPSALSAEAALLARPNAAANFYYISGQLNRNGTGSLDPVLVQPALEASISSPGDYAIELQDSGGNVIGQPFTFAAGFIDVEGEPRDVVPFNFQLPAQENVAKIVLKRGNQVLDTIRKSSGAPSVTVTAPNGGENWSGVQTITWSASDPDGDPLTFTILYSPDNGATWRPVAYGVTGTSYQVDTITLPGSSQGKIRVLVTDGFNTAQDDSNGTFTVAGKPPSVSISGPLSSAILSVADGTTFTGDASDPEDGTLPDSAFVWSYALAGGTAQTNFGTGRAASLLLPRGIYDITLTVTDSSGLAGRATITVSFGERRTYLPLEAR
jgi:hypothetical protein